MLKYFLERDFRVQHGILKGFVKSFGVTMTS